MNAIPLTPETLTVARRLIWFEPPEQALADPVRFMAYALTYARHEDMRVIRRYVSNDDLREALDRAPPGIIDPRSWAYWNSKIGRYPAPPLPARRLPGTDGSQGKTGNRQARGPDLEEMRRRARQEWLEKYGPKSRG
jgi:hypothetical protein